MPVTLKWFNEDHDIIVITCFGRWTWQEAFDTNDQINEMVKQVDHPVDRILDMRDAPYIESNFAQNTMEITKIMHPQLGMLVFVGYKMLWELFAILCRTYDINIPHAHAETIEEAFEIIYQYRNDSP